MKWSLIFEGIQLVLQLLHVQNTIIKINLFQHHIRFPALVMCKPVPHLLCGCRQCFLSEGHCGRGQSASQSARGVSSVTPFQLTKSQCWVSPAEPQHWKKPNQNHRNYIFLMKEKVKLTLQRFENCLMKKVSLIKGNGHNGSQSLTP